MDKKQTEKPERLKPKHSGFVAMCASWLRRPKSWVIIGGGIIALAAIVVGVLFVITTRGNVGAERMSDEDLQAIDRPIRLKFNQQLGEVRPEIKPEVRGTWREKRQLFGVSEVEFTPDQPLVADTNYTVAFPGAKRSLFGNATIHDVSFKTQKVPRVDTTSLDGKEVIAMDQALTVRLGSRASKLRNLELTTEPALGLKRESSDD